MKELSKLKLHNLSKSEMAKSEMGFIIGGDDDIINCPCACSSCTCTCWCSCSKPSGGTVTTDPFLTAPAPYDSTITASHSVETQDYNWDAASAVSVTGTSNQKTNKI